MNVLPPPTDNFYKFFAIGGLVGTVFFLFAPFYLMLDQVEVNARASVSNSRVMASISELMRGRDEMRAVVKSEEAKSTLTADDIQRLKEDRNRLDLVEDRLARLMDHNTTAAKELAVSLARINELNNYSPTSWKLSALCLLFTTCGFVLWKTRHQDLQDRLLAAEVALKEKQAKEGKGPEPSAAPSIPSPDLSGE